MRRVHELQLELLALGTFLLLASTYVIVLFIAVETGTIETYRPQISLMMGLGAGGMIALALGSMARAIESLVKRALGSTEADS